MNYQTNTIQLLLYALLAGLLSLFFKPAQATEAPNFTESLQTLNSSSFKKKAEAIESFAAVEDERVRSVLNTMLAGELYFHKENRNIGAMTEPSDEVYLFTDFISGESIELEERYDYKKIGINNKLRRLLRRQIARLSLDHRDADVRLQAVQDMMGKADEDGYALLRERLPREGDDEVRKYIKEVLALADVDSEEPGLRKEAIAQLGESVHPAARAKLRSLLEKDGNNFVEPDAEIRKAASKALAKIDVKLSMAETMETVFFGLSLGSVLLLAAIGLAITFGVMGVINMAHGELIMIGAYTTYLIQIAFPNAVEYSLLMAIPAAFIVAGLFGIAIERGVIRHLYGRPLETLLATFGISLVLQQLVRTGISAQNVAVSNPSWMSGSLEIGMLSLTYNRLFILIFSLLVFATLVLILKKTSLGLHVRAVSQNRQMARAMGIRSDWVDALTFGLGSGIAGVAGVALSQLTNVGPNMGQAYIIDSFMVVVFGGVGNLWGTLVAAMSLGVINKFLEPVSGAVLAKILVLVFIILFIQKRPRGLFPQKGRVAEH